ncbi:MAG: hypothetical protein ACREVB_08825 [Burkholderiales bacterium]
MFRILLVLLLAAGAAHAQEQQNQPTAEEQAFARLPQDLQAMLGHLPAREALLKLDFARQNLIATGNANFSHERLRGTVQNVLAPGYAAVQSASAGTVSFPPLSPLVPAVAFEAR